MGKGGGIIIALLAAAALFAFSGLGKRRDGTTADDARAEITRLGGDLPSNLFGELFGGITARTGATARPTPIGESRVIPLILPQPGIHFDVGPGTFTPRPPVFAPSGVTAGQGRPIVPRVASTSPDAFTRPPVGSEVVLGASGRAVGFITPEGVQQRRTLALVLEQTGLAPFAGQLTLLGEAAQTNQLAKDVLAAIARLEMEILDGK